MSNNTDPDQTTELKELKEFYENIIEKLPGHIFWKDTNSVLLGSNEQQAKTIGLKSRHDIPGRTCYDMITSYSSEKDRIKQAEEILAIDRRIMSTGVPEVIEEPLTLPTGEKRTFLSNKMPLYNKKQEVIGLLGVAFDITEQKIHKIF